MASTSTYLLTKAVVLQTRMNGGTNMAAACSRAAAEMAHLDAGVQRVVIMMSDFRIDDYSGRPS